MNAPASGPAPVPAYHPATRALHWITAPLVLATMPVGAAMVMEGWARPTQDAMYIFHKNVGVVILVLVLVRLAMRLAVPAPPLPAAMPAWQRRAAGLAHGGLYLLLLVMAVSGYVRVTAGGFPLEGPDALGLPRPVPRSDALAETAKAIHFWARFPLGALIVLHIGAGVMHAAVWRDGVFSRMWPRRA